MTDKELRLIAQTLSQLLIRGDVDALADMFSEPLSFNANGSFRLMTSRDALKRGLIGYYEQLNHAGVQRIEVQSIMTEERTEHRAMLRIRWAHILPDGRPPLVSDVRYVIKRGAVTGQITLELVDYLDLSFPDALCALYGG